jgi:2-polyprenyl-3-methyl-5-hydroxy-6-metoxy-1,4-benzoquinol methylase
MNNPVLRALPQIDQFGWANCTPQHRNLKMRQTFGHIGNMQLLEHIAHAKKFIKEHIQAYIDGKLPTVIRKVKYAADVLKLLKYLIRLVATLNYLANLIAHEVALANQWAQENLLHIDFALSQITPAGLRTAAEAELVTTLNRAKQKIQQQINENGATLECLI